mgnify:CR=1 FL=1
MADSKLVGSINLARLDSVGIMSIKGKSGAVKKCVVIPIDENDIFIKVEEKTTQQGEHYVSKLYSLGIEIMEKREPDQWGNVCHAKLATSKEWINHHTPAELEARNKVFLGNFKSVEIPSSNQAATIEAPLAEMEPQQDDDLPF